MSLCRFFVSIKERGKKMYQAGKVELQAKIAVILGRVSSKPQEDGYSMTDR